VERWFANGQEIRVLRGAVMARAKKRASKPLPENLMGALLEEFLAWMRIRNTADYTQYHRRACVARFIRWATEQGIDDPMKVTRPILEGYQRYLFCHRQKNGEPLTFSTQYSWLVDCNS
jgi:integrase/recombinase XerD